MYYKNQETLTNHKGNSVCVSYFECYNWNH